MPVSRRGLTDVLVWRVGCNGAAQSTLHEGYSHGIDSCHHPDRFSRQRQDHPAQARPDRGARPEDRGDRERVRRREHRQRDPGARQRRADHPAQQRLRLLLDPRGPAHHAGRPGREEAQGRTRFRPGRDRDHRPGRPRAGRADLLHGRRDRRIVPARLDPDAGRRQARRPAARRPAGGAAPDRLRRPDLRQQDRPGRRRRPSSR